MAYPCRGCDRSLGHAPGGRLSHRPATARVSTGVDGKRPPDRQGVCVVFAVLLNAASGSTNRAQLREDIERLFAEAGVEARVRELTHPCDIALAAREALDEHPEALVAGGGDGTVSAVASVLAGTPTPLGVLPLGTLNHFAKDAGIPLDLPKAPCAPSPPGMHERVDVGRVNDRHLRQQLVDRRLPEHCRGARAAPRARDVKMGGARAGHG